MGSMLTGAEAAESVSLVRVPLSFTVQPISPADSFRDLDAVLARNGEQLRNLLLVARAGIYQLGTFGDPAADDADNR